MPLYYNHILIFGCFLSYFHHFHICLFVLITSDPNKVRFVISNLNQCSSCYKLYSFRRLLVFFPICVMYSPREREQRRIDVHHGNYNPSRKVESNMQEDSNGPMTRVRAKQLQHALTNQIAMIEAVSELKISNQFEIGSRVLICLQLKLGDGKSL